MFITKWQNVILGVKVCSLVDTFTCDIEESICDQAASLGYFMSYITYDIQQVYENKIKTNILNR